ncbi:lipid-transfer protein [Pseudomonas jinjuensis]|uniref:Acetyl-CoA acetyltransferase n=1 Tax=Pseudomonas jinjuensis TaxID=198616 RepID=A0A1H0DHP5_9PSED|nr:lipid-transfer protein [Pseudomonas jinjuensis]SDN69702.1 Acetyl-CoA acetyltransferase [Pseudomonas jinjuensis]
MSNKVLVAGVGMIPFSKPGASPSYIEMGSDAVRLALKDAGLDYDKVQMAFAGYVYGDTTCGQAVLYRVGRTAIPVFNVNNACASGSSALYLARAAVESGQVECALAVGFEQMQPGATRSNFPDRPLPRGDYLPIQDELCADAGDIPRNLITFGGAGREHMRKYGTRMETFAAIRAKASRHAANNPLALFRKIVSTEDVMNDTLMWPGVMTRMMACPPTCGAAAAIICSEAFARRHGLRTDVAILAQAMTTDPVESFEPKTMTGFVGAYMAQRASRAVYEKAAVGPQDVRVVELHDCFAHNELLTYESLGLCPEGGAEKFVLDGDNTYGGRVVTNPSGGLLCKGHPLGATGLAQCYELTHQLRGTADKRQVDGVSIALQHNLGLGGACVVTLYGKN